jgi:tetratricopeptide (TPR) repeat protein
LATTRQRLDSELARWPDNLALQYTLGDLLLHQGHYPQAVSVFTRLLARENLSAATRAALLGQLLTALAHQGQHEEVRRSVEAFLLEPVPITAKLHVLDVLGCAPFMQHVPNYLHEAEHWCDEALRLQPGNLTLLGTKGSLLFEQGRWDESEKILRHVLASSEADIDQGICSFYLALLAKRRGEHEAAERLARRARALYSEQWMLARLEVEFPNLGKSRGFSWWRARRNGPKQRGRVGKTVPLRSTPCPNETHC